MSGGTEAGGEAVAGDKGGVTSGGVENATMPAAAPELGSANAASGAVTGASGLDNPVTSGALGTSGALPSAPLGGSIGGSSALPDDLNKPITADVVAPDAGFSPTGSAAGTAAAAPAPVTPTPVASTPTASGVDVGSGGAPAAGEDPLRTAVDKATGTSTAPPQSGISKALQALGITSADGGIGKNALPLALNLGATAVRAGSENSLQKQLQKNAAGPQAASQRLLAEGASGQIPPAVMQQFTQSFNDRVGEITQRYANMGRDAKTDSAAQAEIARARTGLDAQVAQYSQQLTEQGLRAAGVASGPATNAAMAGAQQDRDLSTAMAGSLQQMALLEALQRGQRPAA